MSIYQNCYFFQMLEHGKADSSGAKLLGMVIYLQAEAARLVQLCGHGQKSNLQWKKEGLNA